MSKLNQCQFVLLDQTFVVFYLVFKMRYGSIHIYKGLSIHDPVSHQILTECDRLKEKSVKIK